MIDPMLLSLIGTAAFIAATHTLLGADHYVPFIAMSRAGRWSMTRTLVITTLCGIAHVLSSVVLGAIGIAIGAAVGQIDAHKDAMGTIESARGSVAGWLLLGFGIAYAIWGIRDAIRSRPHSHWHSHADGTVHQHSHTHHAEHAHAHADTSPAASTSATPTPTASMTPWVLFTIFIFGPCEPLIPLLMLPAAQHSPWGVALVASVFGVVTIATMLGMVVAGVLGITGLSKSGWNMERYTHALAGAALAGCGAFVVLGG